MERFWQNVLVKCKEFRNKKFSKVGNFLLRAGITANLMTLLSLAGGLGAVYFLFTNYLWFFILAAFHLLADGLDGVMANSSNNPSKRGRYFDYANDRLIELLLIVKIGWFYHDNYAYLVAGLFLLAQIVYVFSGMKAPILFTRTLILGLVALNLPTIAYLTTGVAVAYSLARQLQWKVEGKKRGRVTTLE